MHNRRRSQIKPYVANWQKLQEQMTDDSFKKKSIDETEMVNKTNNSIDTSSLSQVPVPVASHARRQSNHNSQEVIRRPN